MAAEEGTAAAGGVMGKLRQRRRDPVGRRRWVAKMLKRTEGDTYFPWWACRDTERCKLLADDDDWDDAGVVISNEDSSFQPQREPSRKRSSSSVAVLNDWDRESVSVVARCHSCLHKGVGPVTCHMVLI